MGAKHAFFFFGGGNVLPSRPPFSGHISDLETFSSQGHSVCVWHLGQEVKLVALVLIFSQNIFKMVDPKQISVIFKSDQQKKKKTKTKTKTKTNKQTKKQAKTVTL